MQNLSERAYGLLYCLLSGLLWTPGPRAAWDVPRACGETALARPHICTLKLDRRCVGNSAACGPKVTKSQNTQPRPLYDYVVFPFVDFTRATSRLTE
jgi:hypothetical protein